MEYDPSGNSNISFHFRPLSKHVLVISFDRYKNISFDRFNLVSFQIYYLLLLVRELLVIFEAFV